MLPKNLCLQAVFLFALALGTQSVPTARGGSPAPTAKQRYVEASQYVLTELRSIAPTFERFTALMRMYSVLARARQSLLPEFGQLAKVNGAAVGDLLDRVAQMKGTYERLPTPPDWMPGTHPISPQVIDDALNGLLGDDVFGSAQRTVDGMDLGFGFGFTEPEAIETNDPFPPAPSDEPAGWHDGSHADDRLTEVGTYFDDSRPFDESGAPPEVGPGSSGSDGASPAATPRGPAPTTEELIYYTYLRLFERPRQLPPMDATLWETNVLIGSQTDRIPTTMIRTDFLSMAAGHFSTFPSRGSDDMPDNYVATVRAKLWEYVFLLATPEYDADGGVREPDMGTLPEGAVAQDARVLLFSLSPRLWPKVSELLEQREDGQLGGRMVVRSQFAGAYAALGKSVPSVSEAGILASQFGAMTPADVAAMRKILSWILDVPEGVDHVGVERAAVLARMLMMLPQPFEESIDNGRYIKACNQLLVNFKTRWPQWIRN